ncbi:MAG: dTMP kinase, partial [Candidatus Aminicenantes bacterium]
AEKGLDRIKGRKNKELLFERQDYLVKVRAIFKALRGENIVHIDGEKSQDEISDQISKIVFNYVDRFTD